MTPAEFKEARRKLGLSAVKCAALLGYTGTQCRQMIYDLESGRRPIRDAQRRLIEAYLAGYRPGDWSCAV